MSPTNDAAARRAEARQQRRARHASKGDTDPAQSEEEPDKVGTALRGAAAAAALGAALGAARALATRDDESEDAPEPADVADEAPEPEREPEDSAPAPEPEGEAPEPTLEAQRQPARDERPQPDEEPEGASREAVRSIVARAREQFGELHGTEPESLSALERLGSRGWRVTFEVVEVERVPSSTDLLATYVLELDDDAQLTTYERVRRYYRAQAELGDER